MSTRLIRRNGPNHKELRSFRITTNNYPLVMDTSLFGSTIGKLYECLFLKVSPQQEGVPTAAVQRMETRLLVQSITQRPFSAVCPYITPVMPLFACAVTTPDGLAPHRRPILCHGADHPLSPPRFCWS